MAEGYVKWFNSEKGYGFITPDGGGPDVLVRYSSIQTKGYRSLEDNELVSFAIEPGPEGPQATRVTPLGKYRSPPGVRPGTARRRRRGLLATVVGWFRRR